MCKLFQGGAYSPFFVTNKKERKKEIRMFVLVSDTEKIENNSMQTKANRMRLILCVISWSDFCFFVFVFMVYL